MTNPFSEDDPMYAVWEWQRQNPQPGQHSQSLTSSEGEKILPLQDDEDENRISQEFKKREEARAAKEKQKAAELQERLEQEERAEQEAAQEEAAYATRRRAQAEQLEAEAGKGWDDSALDEVFGERDDVGGADKKSRNLWSWLLFLIYNVAAVGDGVKNAIALKEEGVTVAGTIDLAADVATLSAELADLAHTVKAVHQANDQYEADDAPAAKIAIFSKAGFPRFLNRYYYMLSLGNQWLYTLSAVISAAEAANGSGSPVTGGAFTDSASSFNQVHTTLQSAAADPMKWSGSAADKYRIKNSEQQAFAETVANANRELGNLLHKQASQVEMTRTALASIKLALGPCAFAYSFLCNQILLIMSVPGNACNAAALQAATRRCTIYLRAVGISATGGALAVLVSSVVSGLLTAKSAEAETAVLNEVAKNSNDARNRINA